VEITEVRVKLMEEPGERLQAFCSITFDDAFVVRDLKIIEGSTGPFVAMPSRKLTAHCYQCGCKNHLRAAFCNQCGTRMKEPAGNKDDDGRAKLYADIAHPINSVCREQIQQRVIKAFEEEKSRSKMPGYVPSYEDFDAETTQPAASPRVAPTVTTQIQGAEKPRGPHKLPQHKPQQVSDGHRRDGHAVNGFGAGIFE
jgi:stage V sporulation protein G